MASHFEITDIEGELKAFSLNIMLWKRSRRDLQSGILRIKKAQSGKVSDLYLGTLWFECCPVHAIDDGILFYVNPLTTKRRLLYLKKEFVPRSKHFSSRL